MDRKNSQKVAGVAAIIIAAGLVALIVWKIGLPALNFASEPEKFRDWVDSRGLYGRLAFIGMSIVQVVIALLPGEPFEIAAGYAFGAVEGTILAVVAATAGSMLVFFLVRTFGLWLVEVFFSRKKLDSLRFLKTSEKRNILFLIIFMIPGTPKDLLSYVAGLTDVKLPVWLLICSLGRLPSIITSTVGGSAIGDKNYAFAVAVFAVTMTISIGGILIYNWICRKNSGKAVGQEPDESDINQKNNNILVQHRGDRK